MSPSELNEMEQLDGLAAELTEAGHLARIATANRERPEPAFAMRLRAELLHMLPARGSAEEAAPAGEPVAGVPTPPARPLDAPDRSLERRRANRPFAGPDRRVWAGESEPETLDVIFATTPDGMDPTRAGKRWGVPGEQAGPQRHTGALGAQPPEQPADEAEDAGRVISLKPAVRWHIPTRAGKRWIAAGLAASVAVASLLYGSGIFWSVRTVATADEAVSATLVRGGASSALVAGMELHEGDEIKVAATGQATLQLGGSYVRMASGADLELRSLDPSHVVVDQITGRVYHRVAVPAGGDYKVVTATVTWQADGTAFDLDRHSTTGGGEEVRGLALYHGVAVHGPRLEDSLAEGMSATIVLSPDGAPAGSPVIEPITAQTLADDWLIGNAGLDARLGLPLGQLAAVLSPEPTPSPTDTPTTVPTASPTDTPTVAPTEAPTPVPPPVPVLPPIPVPTPVPTPTATPTPTPTGPANLGQLNITDNGNGSYSFSWPKYSGSGFQYYKLVYADYPRTPNFGSAGSDYWACNSSASDTSWSGDIDVGDYNVRLQVVDESGSKTIIRAQTDVVRLTVAPPASPPPTQDLGPLHVHDNGNGTYTFSWTAYTGGPFSYYKLVYETTASGNDPSYPDGSQFWAVPGTGATSVTLTVGVNNGGSKPFLPGDYQVRIQAIGYPNGAYAYAQTTVRHLVVP